MTTTDGTIQRDRTVEQVMACDLPLLELIGRANAAYPTRHDPNRVQKASLLSIKTGGGSKDCAYCPQSAHHHEVDLTRYRLMDPQSVVGMAATAKAARRALLNGRGVAPSR